MTDPYELYHRMERRRRKIQNTIAIGSVVTLMMILGAIVFWHVSDVEGRIASTGQSTALNR